MPSPSGSANVETAVSTWSSVAVPVIETPPVCGSLTPVTVTVEVTGLLSMPTMSLTVQVTVRLALAPELVGLSLVEEKVIERSAASYSASVAVPVSVNTPAT